MPRQDPWPHSIEPRSLLMVEGEIQRLSHLMNRQTTDLIELSEQWAHADADYAEQRTKQWLIVQDQEGTIPEKEARVADSVQDLYRRRVVLQARMKAAQEAGRNIRAQLDALRSINANARAAADFTRGEGG